MRTQIERATELIKGGLVKLESETENARYFKVKDYDVRIEKCGKTSCTCQFASVWGNQKKDCYHVIACKLLEDNVQDNQILPAESVLAGGQKDVPDTGEQLNIPSGEIRDNTDSGKDGGNKADN